MRTLAFLLVGIVAMVHTEESGNAKSNSSTQEPLPAHSMHRLIPSVVDQTVNLSSTPQFSPGNNSDGVPFLPSGMSPSFRNSEMYQYGGSAKSAPIGKESNFTPSYFIGEVIAEPYVPERFQSPSYIGSNSSSRSFNNLPSSTSLALQHILPYVDQVKQKSLDSYKQGFAGEHHHHNQRVPPVHEPSMEDQSSTTPKYMINYGDQDKHSDRPNSFPYKFRHGYNNMQSTKPISFKDGNSDKKIHNTREDQEYQYEHDFRGSAEDYHGRPEVTTNGHSGLPDRFGGHSYEPKHNFNGHGENYGGFLDPTRDQKNNFEDYLKPHPEHDFVYPTPFYPPEPEYPSDGPPHHKDNHYKVYQRYVTASYLHLISFSNNFKHVENSLFTYDKWKMSRDLFLR